MKNKMKKLFVNKKPIGEFLLASVGTISVLIGFVAFRHTESVSSTDIDFKQSYQKVLDNWKPFTTESEVTEDVSISESTDSNSLIEEEIPVSKKESSSILESEVELPIEDTPASKGETPSGDSSTEESQSAESVEAEINGFSVHPISQNLQETLNEFVTLDPSVITYDDLRLVKVLYWGFDNQTHMGELIVNKAVATEVMEIFEEVYAVRYPIEKIRLVSEYQNSDEASMRDNNTSSFNYRMVTEGNELSMHAYGLAIDINPKMNPYVSEDYVLPANAMAYVDRNQNIPGMIQKGDALYQAFTSRGWEWGGEWSNLKDYQHFSKSIN